MKTETNDLTFNRLPATYRDLTDIVMPRPIHDEVDYRHALKVLDAMAGFPLNADQEDYFEAVSTFVEKYEADRHPLPTAHDPISLIRSLMDEQGMSASDLGRLLGDRSLGHRILSGQRTLSKTHIRRLADRFALDPGALL